MTAVKVEYGKAILFVLDSDEFGVLDENFLGVGEELVDVSSLVVSVSVSRGRTDRLEPVRSGQASVTLRNFQGLLDPLNESSPLFPGVEPARTLNIYADNVQVFSGIVEDIQLDFTAGGDASVQISASDKLAQLALGTFPAAGLGVSEQDSGARVTSIITSNAKFWTDGTAISVGDSILAAGTVTGNVLEELNRTAISEGGLIFVGRDGDLVFRNRLFVSPSLPVVVTDDGSGTFPGAPVISYERIVRQTSGESLRTVALAERAGTTLKRENTLGTERFGERSVDLGVLRLRTDSEVNDRLDFELGLRSVPNPTVKEVTVSQAREQFVEILELELGDRFTVIFTPPNVDKVTQVGTVLNLRHDFTVGQGWRTTVGI